MIGAALMEIAEPSLELIGVFPQIVQEPSRTGLSFGRCDRLKTYPTAKRHAKAFRQCRHAAKMIAKQFGHTGTIGVRTVAEKSAARVIHRVAHRSLRNRGRRLPSRSPGGRGNVGDPHPREPRSGRSRRARGVRQPSCAKISRYYSSVNPLEWLIRQGFRAAWTGARRR